MAIAPQQRKALKDDTNVHTERSPRSKSILSRIFRHNKSPQSISSSHARLTFDCLYLIFTACERLICEESASFGFTDKSQDPTRGYLYDLHEVDPTYAHKQLSACSLVCKSWTLPAQLRMLHSTKLYRASQAQSLISYLQCTGGAGNAIQHLELGREPGEKRDHTSLSRWHIFELLRRCHRIRSLSLLQWRPDDVSISLNSRSQFLPPISLDVLSQHDPFERLTSLRLHQFVGSCRTLVELLLLVPGLESLSFEGKTTELDYVSLSSLPPPPFKLQRLSVAGYDGGFLDGISWILASSWRTLRRLDLGSMEGPMEPELLAGLLQPSNSINFLSLTRCQHIDIASIIQSCSQLKGLRIDGTASHPIPLDTPPLFDLLFIGEFTPTNHAAPSAINKVRLGKSPSAREMDDLMEDLDNLQALSNLRSLSLEFNTRRAYPDAPLTQLRAVKDYCSSRRIAMDMPDLYDLVMGSRQYHFNPTEEGRNQRHSRFFTIHI
ncbi:uncharacterized protein EI90DRAFT_333188 [Cantharellus anzutake]|uniref:uncharacterized protein n=1 Tax=Cantharellus anzutake TaxID=1750568 RepID=UPI001907D870|nr:uncharacterized protein EI90DRAFT_333188 [Cantharellus anzutake]KAF8335477.1 hypothetical protein EI90DRAFT_333188 [Cantharellus anzutake]